MLLNDPRAYAQIKEHLDYELWRLCLKPSELEEAADEIMNRVIDKLEKNYLPWKGASLATFGCKTADLEILNYMRLRKGATLRDGGSVEDHELPDFKPRMRSWVVKFDRETVLAMLPRKYSEICRALIACRGRVEPARNWLMANRSRFYRRTQFHEKLVPAARRAFRRLYES